MVRQRSLPLFSAGDLLLSRVDCDGRDACRPVEERIDGDRIVVGLLGRYAYRDRSRRAVVGPGTALFLRAGQGFEISHPHGEGDASLSIRGGTALGLMDAGGAARALPAAAYARLLALSHGLTRATADPLAVEEELCEALAPPDRSPTCSPRDREVADAISYHMELHYDAPLPLHDLAGMAGVSVYHACRAFRRARGTSIHRHRQEIRLRHAVALLLETRRPLAQVAAECGFANQGHLGNAFRRRFDITPGQARTPSGWAALGRSRVSV